MFVNSYQVTTYTAVRLQVGKHDKAATADLSSARPHVEWLIQTLTWVWFVPGF